MSIEYSVIVPAYHEKLNIKPLTTRLFAGMSPEMAKKTELIFVDDNSQDGSVEEVDALAHQGYNVRIIVRTNERGLSSAVLKGFYEAKGQYLVHGRRPTTPSRDRAQVVRVLARPRLYSGHQICPRCRH
ncbi:AFH_G0023240.mRNA.1.CDS.1 [Saccharomyces cerevisiae]|nr:AFH_G0023240.mRNA.1.CDS.1 [Saccharomyces cerevisiae]CAI6725961.1 AFH_G0023240.mRNA.1.CDS.1 [Saccharomyces cerevisiae]